MEPGKKERSHIKGEKTKQKLFTSAVRLFERYDFNEVTVDRIVEDAGVAKGTFYIYFESKDALIAAFLSDYVKETDTDYRAILDSFPPETPASQVLLGLAGKITDKLTNTIGLLSMRTVYKLMLTNSFDMSAVSGYNRDLYFLFTDVLEKGIQNKEFNFSMPTSELARHFVMAVRGLSFEWCIRYPDFDLEAQILTHLQILLNGIIQR